MKSISKMYNKLSWGTRNTVETIAVGIGAPTACLAFVVGVAALTNQLADPSPDVTPNQHQQNNLSPQR